MNATRLIDEGATVRIAFAGLRHPHIFDLHKRCRESDDFEIVAICEPDKAAAAAALEQREIQTTHTDLTAMLNSVDCDAVAIGDYYGIRGSIALAALRAGKHVIADKPICTSLAELDEIESLCKAGGLKFGCMLDMRDSALGAGLFEVVRSGRLGDVQAISFNGQHPLNYGTRPGWYFEDGKHGGTLNDIAIHAFDLIPWIAGSPVDKLLGAYVWYREPAEGVKFQTGGQCMFTLANGAGVLGDVSYLAPDSFGYGLPSYWEYRIWGSGGMVEGSYGSRTLRLFESGSKEVQELPCPQGRPGGYLADFLADLRGQSNANSLTTAKVLRAARLSLEMQQMGDKASSHRG